MPQRTHGSQEDVDLVLHIGSGKTGTSSIQAFMNENRAELAEEGILYPRSPGATRHTRLGLYIKDDESLAETPSWRRQSFSSPAEFRREFRSRLDAELAGARPGTLVFSDEALFGSPPAALDRLSGLAAEIADSVRVVVYLRRQDDHLVSRYQQVVKVGERRKLAARTRETDFSGVYDYEKVLGRWRRALQPAEVVVRRFERHRFPGGSLVQDFLDAVGSGLRVDDLAQVDRRNVSLDAESVELLRVLNVVRHDHPDVALPGNGTLVARLATMSDGPTLTLPPDVLDEFMDTWAASNEAVAREYFPESDGSLFATGRRVEGTTSRQHLDPSRLDPYLAVLKIPTSSRAVVRRVVEQEADTPSPAPGRSPRWWARLAGRSRTRGQR